MTDQLQVGTEQRPTTTQLTSKRIKLIMLFGVLSMFVGLIMALTGRVETSMLGFLLVLFGLFTFIAGKFMKWWKHE